MITNINAHAMSLVQPLYLREKVGDPNLSYYIFVLLCILHVILENKKIISTTYFYNTYSFFIFRAYVRKIHACLRRWQGRSKLDNWGGGGGADTHIHVFTHHKNNGFQKKLIVQNKNI